MPELIHGTSCSGATKYLHPAFQKALPADWERAAMFSALFYTFLFYGEPHFPRPRKPLPPLKPYEPVAAFKKAKKRLPKLTGWWKMFDYGDEIP